MHFAIIILSFLKGTFSDTAYLSGIIIIFLFYLSVGILFIVNLIFEMIIAIMSMIRFTLIIPGRRKTSKFSKRLAIFLLCVFVKFSAPYQFGYVIAFLVKLGNTVSLINPVLERSAYNYQKCTTMFMLFGLSFAVPVNLVWIKNLSVNWVSSFDHDLIHILPVLLYSSFIKGDFPVSVYR